MNTFLEIYSLPRVNGEELKNLNRIINSKEIEKSSKNSSKVKVQSQMASLVNFTNTEKKI